MTDSINMVQLTPQEEAADGFTEIRRILSDREQATMEALAEADALQITAESLRGQLTQMGDTLSPLYALAHSRRDLFPAKVGESLLPVIVKRCLEAFQAPATEAQKPGPGPKPEDLRAAVGNLLSLRHCLSYDESYCGEPAGAIKRAIAEWERQGAKAAAPWSAEVAVEMPAEPSRRALEARILDLEGGMARHIERAGKGEAEKRDLTRIVSALRVDLAVRDKAMAAIHDAGGVEAFRQAIADAARAPLLARIADLQIEVQERKAEYETLHAATIKARQALGDICPF